MPQSKRQRLSMDSTASVPSPSDRSPMNSIVNTSLSDPNSLNPSTILITINNESVNFEISQLSNIKYFRDKWSQNPQLSPSPETFENVDYLTMASFVKMVVFANQPKDRNSLRRLSISAQDVLPWLKTIAHFGIDDITVAMMEEYFDSYPAVPGIPHKVLSSWYQAKIRSIPAVAKFATKKMTEIYQMFNLPNVQRAKDIMDQFRSEHCAIFYDEEGSFKPDVTRERVEGIHYEFIINFCHFYQCLVWKDFHGLVQSVTALIRDFNAFAVSVETVNDRFETFPFHEV